MAHAFAKMYPNIAYWIEARGWIEMGADENSSSLVRCLDEGGMVWESPSSQHDLDKALQSLEKELQQWL